MSFNFNDSLNSLSTTFSPWAKRTQRMVQEKLGNVEDVTELPQEYLELEARVDALKIVHQKLLAVTSNYENEGYDYPPNLRESLTDLSKTITEKVQGLSQVSSAAEAQSVLTAPGSKKDPKTMNHALGRAALGGVAALKEAGADSDDPLSEALQKYAIAEEKIGEGRLSQDTLIANKFNAAFHTTLNTSLQFAAKARANVRNARLTLDAVKASAKAAKPEQQGAARAEVEQAEDEFVAATEEAVGVMKNALDTPEPLRNLVELVSSQLAYHKLAYETLKDLLPEVEELQNTQETKYRESREAAIN
ncbi:Protein GVP36 [Yarrowia sp. C11]|nr:Protein GVP36 [Yarrowia sp. E02]KAG5372466.1 Protein GVP36 [Yarrowia sp. C11]